MSVKTQVMDNIKEAIGKIHKRVKYKKMILTYLFDLLDKEKYQDLSDSEFYDIVREIFKLNPKNFIEYLYNDLRRKIRRLYGKEKRKELEENILEKDFIGELLKSNPEDYMEFVYKDLRNKIGKKYGDERRREIERYILEKHCLNKGEVILYECFGDITKTVSVSKLTVHGDIFVTNQRIFAQGNFFTKGVSVLMSLCYGYIFPITNLYKLKKRSSFLIYKIEKNKFKIIPSSPNRKKKLNKLFEILSNNTNVNLKALSVPELVWEEKYGIGDAGKQFTEVGNKVEISPSK